MYYWCICYGHMPKLVQARTDRKHRKMSTHFGHIWILSKKKQRIRLSGKLQIYWIWDSRSGGYEEYCLLRFDAVLFDKSPTFQRNISPPFSGSKSKPSKKPAISERCVEILISCTPGGNYERANGSVTVVCNEAERELRGARKKK
jgi:hypothetical protein